MSDAKKNIYYGVEDLVLERGDGIYLYDSDGKKYLDCEAATFNLSLGYSNKEVIEAAKKQMDNLIHAPSAYQTKPVNNLVKKLVECSPDNLTKVHLKVASGSEANEGAVKIAMHHTGKRDILSQFRSHLGGTMMTTAMSGNAFRRKPFPDMCSGCLHIPDPYCYRCFYGQKPETCNMLCVERINDFIECAGSGETACLIMEPISGNGGNIVPPKKYFSAVKKLCEEQKMEFILDEIQTGFGRTGKMFASQYFDIKPNMITFAKGLGGTGFQIAGILTEDRLADLDGCYHSFTFGANSMACAAGAKTIEIISRPGFLENVTKCGDYIMKRLYGMQKKYKFMGDIRGVGLMIGVEVIKEDGSEDVDLTNHIAHEAKNQGLLIRTSRYGRGNVFKIRPALNITPDQCVEMCDKVDKLLGGIR